MAERAARRGIDDRDSGIAPHPFTADERRLAQQGGPSQRQSGTLDGIGQAHSRHGSITTFTWR
jgi:hypothetical protein